MAFDRERVARQAAALAGHGVYVGTSSWKYPGWCDQLYRRSRYEFRKRFADSRFKRECLSEYADVFKTVCVDAAYYSFPSQSYLEGMAAQVPKDFQFAFKVTDEVTIKRYPNLNRFGPRAGTANANFLDPDRFVTGFLHPCEFIRPQVGLLIFEFSQFYPADYRQGREFVADLDRFLEQLPGGWPYAVELRNRHWLQPDYFECLARHHTTHVFNSWRAMPAVDEQIAVPGSRPESGRVAARFLLKPGRSYTEAVQAFQPYDQLREVYPEARAAAVQLIREGMQVPKRNTYLYVNNRLEGSALETIQAVLDTAAP